MAEKKLNADLGKLFRDPPPGVSASLISDDNIFEWQAMITGPEDTPFEGGTFKLKLQFTPDYPNKAPTVWFFSQMFHPNVYKNGRICLDILEEPDKWSSDYDAAAVLCGIQSMLGDPNPNSPANGEANGLFQRDKVAYETRVREIVEVSERNAFQEEDGDRMVNENVAHSEYELFVEDQLNQIAIQELEHFQD